MELLQATALYTLVREYFPDLPTASAYDALDVADRLVELYKEALETLAIATANGDLPREQ